LFLTLWSHDWPCRNFHLHGECEDGENCKYSHEELTDETRPLLEMVPLLALSAQVIFVKFCSIPAALAHIFSSVFSELDNMTDYLFRKLLI